MASDGELISNASNHAICFSHLRWDFVFQRPQHLIQQLAGTMPVIFWEEPIVSTLNSASLELIEKSDRLTVARLLLPENTSEQVCIDLQRHCLDEVIAAYGIENPLLWYYSPLMFRFSDHVASDCVVYDCMDELSAFKGAHPIMRHEERRLMARADLVFTGGQALYEAKRAQHSDIHLFPSSVDVGHFATARRRRPEVDDQRHIPFPRLGFYGVIDERFDTDLLREIALARPAWQFVMLGPVVKIPEEVLPRLPNIHYLGSKAYSDLPTYVSGWDVALMPFAINEATRFISPTKLPEYLASGRPVVSTPITDVVRHYGAMPGVRIADGAPEFITAIEQALNLRSTNPTWLSDVDKVLAGMSWHKTWARMLALIEAKRAARPATRSAVILPFPGRGPHIARRASFDYLIVGAGFAGSVLAERLARDNGSRVMLIDKRGHVGGNAYDHHDAAGLLVHRYGPHIFHTNSERIVRYLSRFTQWRPYEHRVLANVNGQLLPVPINRTTINRFFGLSLQEAEVQDFLNTKALPLDDIRTSEDIVLSRVGRELYEAFFKGYTRKQWGMDPMLLDKSVAGRIPVRTNDDDRYFNDKFQQMPRHGYTRLFENMLDHRNITISLNTSFQDLRSEIDFGHLIFTGPVDEYFDQRLGVLPYRSLSFIHVTLDREQFQSVAVVNQPGPETPYTRITEYKHLTGQQHPRTSISYELPDDKGDPYYPVPQPESDGLYAAYQKLADAEQNVSFVGRLGTYRYYNMDQVVGQALTLYDRLRERTLPIPSSGSRGDTTLQQSGPFSRG